jgi:flagellar motor switch protein FliG
MAQRAEPLTNRRKAAILLISLGPEVAASVYSRLTPSEVEQLTWEIANLRHIDLGQRDTVLQEFSHLAEARDHIVAGGVDFAREVLRRTMGPVEAERLLERLAANLQSRPFQTARKADPQQLLSFLQDEHPQTMALVLSYLDPLQAAQILSALPQPLQADVARRIALMEGAPAEVIAEVERVLEHRLSVVSTRDRTKAGGIDAVVRILNGVDRGTEKAILETLEREDSELAEAIKKRLFVFDDIVHLDDRSLQRVIREVDKRDLQLALKAASREVQEAIYRNMSKRMAESFQEEIQFLGPVRLREVEEAQQRIVNIIRRLEETGEVLIVRGGGDEIIV